MWYNHCCRQTTQLQRKLDAMAGTIGQFGLAAALVSLLGMALPFTYATFVAAGEPWSVAYLGDYLHFLIQAITILVVAVPEGLPLAVTIALAFSVKRMLAENNLVRNLAAAETMGCATTICTDKTGARRAATAPPPLRPGLRFVRGWRQTARPGSLLGSSGFCSCLML